MLTQKEHQTLSFIKEYISKNDYSPTTGEIAEGINIKSRGVVYRYLKSLEQQGVIKLLAGKRRNIALCDGGSNAEIPIAGKIAAGSPLEVIEPKRKLNLNEVIKNRFLLQVEGDSMTGDSINSGDFILCERRESYSSDEILVVIIDGQEAALKRVKKVNETQLALHSSNPTYPPKSYANERVEIQGAYIGLIRLN